ncbi:DNA helicase [Entamoeba marina]
MDNNLSYTPIKTLPTPVDVNTCVQFEGTVLRSSNPKLLEYQRVYMCKKCKQEVTVQATVETSFQFEPPPFCNGINRSGDNCRNKKYKQVGDGDTKDYQELQIQEQTQNLVSAGLQRRITVILLGDLVGDVQAGDFVTVKGKVNVRWLTANEGDTPDLEIVVTAHEVISKSIEKMAVTITEDMKQCFMAHWQRYADRPLAGRDAILASISPELCGLRLPKLAVLLVAIGGNARVDETVKTRTRGTIHLLFVGEPGTGKSQLLKFVAGLGPRHVQTTGGGTTSAGLTVAVTNDHGEVALDAGALVLADGGVCCIDEFSAVEKNDRSDIHEAMEQQTLSVAKAGIVSQLHTRTAVLAATNPKGRYDPNKSMSVNTAIDPPLLSRFDIILLILDPREREWDSKVADHVLRGGKQADAEFSKEQLQRYITHVKTHFHPQLSQKAEVLIHEYYQFQRKRERSESSRTTVRLLESLVRIAQAHAKLMMHDVVELMDAVAAVLIVDSPSNGASNSRENSEFPEDPDQAFQRDQFRLLQSLHCEHLLDDEVDVSDITTIDDDKSKSGQTHTTQHLEESGTNKLMEEYQESLVEEGIQSRKKKNEVTGIVFPSQRMRGEKSGKKKVDESFNSQSSQSTSRSSLGNDTSINVNPRSEINKIISQRPVQSSVQLKSQPTISNNKEDDIDDILDIFDLVDTPNDSKKKHNVSQPPTIPSKFKPSQPKSIQPQNSITTNPITTSFTSNNNGITKSFSSSNASKPSNDMDLVDDSFFDDLDLFDEEPKQQTNSSHIQSLKKIQQFAKKTSTEQPKDIPEQPNQHSNITNLMERVQKIKQSGQFTMNKPDETDILKRGIDDLDAFDIDEFEPKRSK